MSRTTDVLSRRSWVQVGGGAGGTELALSMQFRLRQELQRVGRPTENVRFTLVTRSQVRESPAASLAAHRHDGMAWLRGHHHLRRFIKTQN